MPTIKERGEEYLRKRSEEQGFVLIVGMLVMAVLLLLAVPFLYQVSFENKLTTKSYKSSAALSLAEAGVESNLGTELWRYHDLGRR